MHTALVRVSISIVRKHNNQKQLGEKGFVSAPQFHVTACHCGKPGQELKAEAAAEVLEARCLLACSLWLPQSTFSTPQDHQLRANTATVSDTLPHQSFTKAIPHRLVLQPGLMEAFSQSLPFPRYV